MAQPFAFEWSVTPQAAFSQLTQAYAQRIRQGVRQIAEQRAPQIEEWMKANHPWQNRTGAAEANLQAFVEEMALDIVAIILENGVEYGMNLELIHAGSLGILTPAVDQWGAVIWQDVRAMLS